MEEESFEDEEIARYINENYIPIKVDREERPDVDAIYMAAVQALTGRGGWPMTVWLTPDRKPFYGGTYYPARDGDRGAGIGFLTLLKKIKQSYQDRKDLVNQTSRQLTDVVKQMLAPEASAQPMEKDILKQSFQSYQKRFDPLNGGLREARKPHIKNAQPWTDPPSHQGVSKCHGRLSQTRTSKNGCGEASLR